MPATMAPRTATRVDLNRSIHWSAAAVAGNGGGPAVTKRLPIMTLRRGPKTASSTSLAAEVTNPLVPAYVSGTVPDRARLVCSPPAAALSGHLGGGAPARPARPGPGAQPVRPPWGPACH